LSVLSLFPTRRSSDLGRARAPGAGPPGGAVPRGVALSRRRAAPIQAGSRAAAQALALPGRARGGRGLRGGVSQGRPLPAPVGQADRKSTRLNSSHVKI